MCCIKNNVKLLVSILLLCNIALNSCKRVLIHRNVTDTFRVGTNGCKNDPSICETRAATCQTNGRCLCGEDSPNFRNPLILESGEYGQTYGCTKSESIWERHRVGLLSCQIKPFQVVPYTFEDRPTKFTADMNLLHCYLRNGKQWTRAKLPENSAEVNLEWLDASYVNLTVLDKNVYFKWKKPVQRLQGTIITLGVSCQITKATRQQMCLVAKVSGSRSADIIERPTFVLTQPSSRPTTSQLSTTMTTSATTSDVSSTDTMTTSPRSSTRSSHSGALPCILKPFQVIPYSPEDPPTKFTVEDSAEERLLNCYLLNVTRGQSNDAAEMQLRWLDKSYVNLTVLNRDLFFKWKKPVPNLKGTIITISFSCQIAEKVRQRICLTAKVFGPSPTVDIIGRSTSGPTQPSSTLTTSELSTTMPTSATTADDSSTDTMATSPRSSTRADVKSSQLSSPLNSLSSSTPTTPTENPDTTAKSPAKPASQTDAVTTSQKSSPPDTITSTFVTTKRSNKPTTYEGNLTNKLASPKLLATSKPPREVPGSDGNFKWTLIAIAVVVPVLFFAVLVVVLCYLSKRKKNNQRYLRPGSFELRTSSSTSVQELRDIGANVRGLDHSDAIVTENLLYSTSEGQSAIVEVINPFYESFDEKNKNVAESDLSSDHRYETPDVRKRQGNGFQSTSGFGINTVATEQSGCDGPLPDSLYETVDCEMTEVNGGPDLKKKTNDKADGKIGTAILYEDLDRVNSDLKKNEIDPKGRKKETSAGNVVADLSDDSDDETHDVKKIEYDGDMLDKLKVDGWDRTSLNDDGIRSDGKNTVQSSSGSKPVATVGNLYTRVHRNENSKKDDDFNNTGSSSRLMIPGREDPNESGCHLNQPTESADTVREALLKK